MSVYKVILVGNLGRDAELRYTTGGQAVATLSLATSDTRGSRDGDRRDQTDWHRVTLWGKQAESLAQHLTKGKRIYVDGRVRTRRVPRCRNCDAFIRQSTEIAHDAKTRDLPEMRCQQCNQSTRPYLETQIDVTADTLAFVGGAGQGGGEYGSRPRGGDAAAGPASDATPMPSDDDIPF